MEEFLEIIVDNIIILVTICCIVFLVTIFYISSISEYQNNYLEVLVNNEPVRFYYEQEYHNGLIQTTSVNGWGGHNQSYKIINNYSMSDLNILNINEYVVSNSNNQIINNVKYNNKNSNYTYEPTSDSIISLKIENKNGVLYDGNYINDISEYITGKGRYYFHIDIISKRTPKIISSVNTKISFNILVGDSYEY